WVSFYHQKWVIASLNNCVSQIDSNIWKSSPDNTNIVKASHALSNRCGKSLKLMSAILQGRKLDKKKFTAIRIHQQYNVLNHGRDKGIISRNVLSNKHRVTTINSDDSNESNQNKSLTVDKLEYQE
ncbi:16294_t:CDS:2, partial [Racocetra persica]